VITLPADPFPAGPRDLPDLRLKLLERWRPGHAYHRGAQLEAEPLGDIPGTRAPSFDGTALAHASLWWVTAEMTRRVGAAATKLPATTLNDDLVPEPFGLVVFAEALVGTDANTEGHEIDVHAIVWGRVASFPDGRMALITRTSDGQLDDEDVLDRLGGRKALTISSYQWWATAGRHTGGGAAWIPLGRSEWIWGEDTADVSAEGIVDFDEQKRASMEEDRRWLATLWLLAAQPLATSVERTSPARPAARRSARAKVSSDVRLVDVRRQHTTVGHADEGDGRPVRWSHRWIVGGEDGFWRQQACGPRWSEHRPVWIAPFVKGPPDKPLVVPEKVNVVREDRP
jgi:hypothetical protein